MSRAGLALLLLAVVGCDPIAPLPELKEEDISVRLGPNNSLVTESWSSVQVRVKNRGETFNGVLEVRGGNDPQGAAHGDNVLYRMPLEVPGKGSAERQVSFPVFVNAWTYVTVAFRQPGYVFQRSYELKQVEEAVDFDPDVEPGATSTVRLLVFGEAVPALEQLKKHLQMPNKRTSLGIPPVQTPRSLPAVATAFDPYYLVVLYGTALDDAPEGALEAFGRWVERGGSLVVVPGPAWSGGLPPALAKLLSVERAAGDAAPADLKKAYGKAASSAYHAGLVPAGSAKLIEDGLAVEARRGLGTVTTLAFGPTGAELPTEPEAPGLYRVLERANQRALGSARESNALLRYERFAETDLRGLASFRVPPRSAVVWGLVIYLAAGFFVPGMIFRWLKRPEWTYVVLVVVAASFTVLIHRYGLLSALQDPEIEEINVLRVHADGQGVEATSYVGVMSPNAREVRLFDPQAPRAEEHPLHTALPRPFLLRDPSASWTAELFRESHTIDVDRAGRLRMGPVPLAPNELRAVRYDYRLPPDRIPAHSVPFVRGERGAGIAARLAQLGLVPESSGKSMRYSRASVFPGAWEITERHAVTIVIEEDPAE